jgi:hypothetical protein
MRLQAVEIADGKRSYILDGNIGETTGVLVIRSFEIRSVELHALRQSWSYPAGSSPQHALC